MTRHPAFVTTHWSMVLTAGRQDSTRAHDALTKLCQTYWRPLYAYVRRRGYSPHDAEDLTQAFFARLLERNDVAGVSPERGRFRSYLLGAMNHFLSDEWDKARAQKRGGGRVIRLDSAVAEAACARDLAGATTPETVYDRRWALLMGERSAVPYVELAGRLNLSEGAVKVAVHRLRQRYRRLLRELVAETVSSPDEIEEELGHLVRTLSRT